MTQTFVLLYLLVQYGERGEVAGSSAQAENGRGGGYQHTSPTYLTNTTFLLVLYLSDGPQPVWRPGRCPPSCPPENHINEAT